MSKQLMFKAANAAKSAFMRGMTHFNLFGVEFTIAWLHDNEYAVNAPKVGEIFRIYGNKNNCRIVAA